MRAHNLLYALGGALAVPVVPTASRYVATGDQRRLRDLVVRGTRYTLALFVPVCVTLIVLAEPILEAWLGDRYAAGDVALAILVSYWLLYGGLVVTPGFLVGAGRARDVARIMVCVAVANLALSLALTPGLGLEGPAVATAVPFVVAFPLHAAARPVGIGGVARATSPAAPGPPTTCSARCSRSRWWPAGPCCRWTRRSPSSPSPAAACWPTGPSSTRWCSTRPSAALVRRG